MKKLVSFILLLAFFSSIVYGKSKILPVRNGKVVPLESWTKAVVLKDFLNIEVAYYDSCGVSHEGFLSIPAGYEFKSKEPLK